MKTDDTELRDILRRMYNNMMIILNAIIDEVDDQPCIITFLAGQLSKKITKINFP